MVKLIDCIKHIRPLQANLKEARTSNKTCVKNQKNFDLFYRLAEQ